MTRRELLNTMDSKELSMWAAYFKEKNRKPEDEPVPKEVLVGQLKNAFAVRKKGKPLEDIL
jgi:hypothetical protein